MGREAVAVARWRGEVAEVKALLEAGEIILRGAIRARIARGGISGVRVEEDELGLVADGEPLVLELGAKEAAKWRDALLKPPPSLADKLGIGPNRPAFVIGAVDDPALAAALEGATVAAADAAHLLIAVLGAEADLPPAFDLAALHPALPLWCVHPKGRDATVSDAAIRAFMRERFYVDSKSCAVSDRLTATRYGRRK